MSHVSSTLNNAELRSLSTTVSTLSTNLGTLTTSFNNTSYKLVPYSRTLTISTETSSVTIGIPEYVNTTDTLHVFVDGIKLNSDQYSSNATTITTVAPLAIDKKVDIMVLKVVKQ